MFKQLRKENKTSYVNVGLPITPRKKSESDVGLRQNSASSNIFAASFNDEMSEFDSSDMSFSDIPMRTAASPKLPKLPASPKTVITHASQIFRENPVTPKSPRIAIPKMQNTIDIDVKPATPTNIIRYDSIKEVKSDLKKTEKPKPAIFKDELTTSIGFPDLVVEPPTKKKKIKISKIDKPPKILDASIEASTVDIGYEEVTDHLSGLRLRDPIKYINATGELKYGVIEDKSYDKTLHEYTFRLRASIGGGFSWNISSLRVKRFWRLIKQDQRIQTTIDNITKFLDMKYNGEFSIFNEDPDRFILVMNKIFENGKK